MNDFGGNDEEEFSIPADTGEGSKYQFAEGEYPVVCVALNKHKKQGGSTSLKWTFRILPEGGVGQGLTFDMYTGLENPKAIWKTHAVAKSLGIESKDEKGNLVVKKKDAIGRRAMGTFKDEEYNGRMSTKLQDVTAHPQGFGPVELTPDDLPF